MSCLDKYLDQVKRIDPYSVNLTPLGIVLPTYGT